MTYAVHLLIFGLVFVGLFRLYVEQTVPRLLVLLVLLILFIVLPVLLFFGFLLLLREKTFPALLFYDGLVLLLVSDLLEFLPSASVSNNQEIGQGLGMRWDGVVPDR